MTQAAPNTHDNEWMTLAAPDTRGCVLDDTAPFNTHDDGYWMTQYNMHDMLTGSRHGWNIFFAIRFSHMH